MGRQSKQIRPLVPRLHQHLLLLLALELLVIELGGAALVGGELSGHDR
jgi:hypothetical protein